MPKFKVGDKVIFVGGCNDHLESKRLKEIYDNKTILEISYVYKDNKCYDVKGEIWNFDEYELEFAYPKLEYPTMDIVTQQVLADIKRPKLYDMYVDGKFENIIEKGEDKMKILEIYSREAFSKIDEKYDKLKKEVIEEDNIQKIIEDTENQINVMLDREEDNRITIGYRNYFEPKTQVKLVELEKQKDAEKASVEKLIEEVKARLEICDNDEFSKVNVLQTYKILDEHGKIAEYKIEKKGRI